MTDIHDGNNDGESYTMTELRKHKPRRRRPQFKRCDPVNADIGTDDDIDIIRYTADHGYRRTSDYCRRKPHRSQKHLRGRLRTLYDHRYLDRLDAQKQRWTRTGKKETIHALGPRGAELLCYLDGRAPPKSNTRQKNRLVQHPHIDHTLLTADIKDAAGRLPSHLPHIYVDDDRELLKRVPVAPASAKAPWLWEGRIPHPDGQLKTTTTNPDLVFGLDLTDQRQRFYFVAEADTGSEPVVRTNHKQTAVAKKFAVYLAGFHAQYHRRQFGLSNVRFLIVTSGPKRIETMLQALAEVAGTRDHSMFFFAESAALRNAPHLLAVPWIASDGQPAPNLNLPVNIGT